MSKPLLIDGAMGTELNIRGVSTPLPLWSAEANIQNSKIVLDIHKDYIKSGSRVITTNTFRTTPWTYKKAGYSDKKSKEVARSSLYKAVDIAHKASEKDVLIAGSITSVDDCYRPLSFPGLSIAEENYGYLVDWLVDAGVDLLLFETMGNIIEINCALNIAKNEWGCLIGNNPLSMIKLPTNNPSRTRRLLKGEYNALKYACEQNPNPWFYPLFILAIETGMRRSELLNIEWQSININNRLCRILYTKNGEERIIPLSTKAIEVLKQLPRAIKGKVFPIKKTTVRSLWERTCKKTNIKGLRFHDLRHEATSRLFEKGLSIMEVASITGHKDIRMLRTYTHLQTNNLVKKLDTESIEYI